MFSFKNLPLEQAAEFQFYIRKIIHDNLKNSTFPDALMKAMGWSHSNYYDLWKHQNGDRFMDMTTMVRIGAAIEGELRTTYMRLKGHANLVDLHEDPDFNLGAFQRIMPWHEDENSARALIYKVGIDLEEINSIDDARKVMAHRHLYAHNVGLVDEKYISHWLRLTGEDVSLALTKHGYPEEDCYWFQPLDDMNNYIEVIQHFVRDLQSRTLSD